MNKSITILLSVIVIFAGFSFADSGSQTSKEEKLLGNLSDMLYFIYEDDPLAFPADANDITALGESADSRDMLALALIQLMQEVREGKLYLGADVTVEAEDTVETSTIPEVAVVEGPDSTISVSSDDTQISLKTINGETEIYDGSKIGVNNVLALDEPTSLITTVYHCPDKEDSKGWVTGTVEHFIRKGNRGCIEQNELEMMPLSVSRENPEDPNAPENWLKTSPCYWREILKEKLKARGIPYNDTERGIDLDLEKMEAGPDSFSPEIVIVEPLITTTQVWEPNKIYKIDGPVKFEGKGVQWIPSPGTIILLGPEGKLTLGSGAIPTTGVYTKFSQADPNMPDEENPVTPVWIFAEDPNALGFIDYETAIELEDPNTTGGTITNFYIEGAFIGIKSERNTPIIGNFFYACMRPIVVTGHKSKKEEEFDVLVVNNQAWYSGIELDEHHPWAPIDIRTDSNDLHPYNAMIAFNTCHDQGCGIMAHGHTCINCQEYLENPEDPNNPIPNPNYHDPNSMAPTLYCLNNITTYSWWHAYGFYDGTINPVVICPGLGANVSEINIPLEFENPIWSHVNPYADIDDYRVLFLKEDCVYKNAGIGQMQDFPWLLGTTTSTFFYPDEGAVDLGVHYHHSKPNYHQVYSNTDIDHDGWTNLEDYGSFASSWGTITRLSHWPGDPNDFHIDPNSIAYKSDFNEDGIVDLGDLIELAENWISYGDIPDHPEYRISFTSSSPGWLNVYLDGYTDNAREIFLKLGNTVIGSFQQDEDVAGRYCFNLKKSLFGEGLQHLQVCSFDEPDGITLSDPHSVYFDQEYSHIICDAEEEFISGFYSRHREPNIVITNLIDEQIVWSSDIQGPGFNFSMPSNLFSIGGLNSVAFNSTDEGSGNPIENWKEYMSKPFTVPMPSDPNFAAWSVFKTVVVLPYEDLVDARLESLKAAYKTIYMKKGPYAALTLYDSNANYVNVGRALRYLPNTDSLHMLTHGNYQYGVGGIFSSKHEISFFRLHKGSYRGLNYVPVFWRLGRNTPNDPSDDGIPSEDSDENGLSAWDWNLYSDPKIKISVLDFCFSVRNDRVPSSLGVFSNDNYQNHDQVAVGWIEGAKVNWDDYGGLIKQFWVLLRTNSVYHAALECVLHPEGGTEAYLNFKMSLPVDDDYAKLINFN